MNLSNGKNNGNQADPIYDISQHRMTVTFFENKFAARQNREKLTLIELADTIRRATASKKFKLPWLKLATFGDIPNAKNCLRYNANVIELNGVEIEHDAGTMTFEAAVEAMRQAEVRCLVYTSPSFTPVEKERWRVLLPLSNPASPDMHARLTARVNGVLKGAATADCFVLSQSYLYGRVGGNSAHAVEVIDGSFIDLCDDLDAGAVGKPKRAPISVKEFVRGSTAPGRTDDEIKALLARSLERGPGGEGMWHNSMRDAIASMVGKGWSNNDIYEATAPFCRDGWGDDDVKTLIAGARVKWGVSDPGITVRQLGETLRDLMEKTAQPQDILFDSDEPPEPGHGATIEEKIAWLLATRGFFENEDAVVQLYAEALNCRSRPSAFARRFKSWFKVAGTMARPKPVFASDIWEMAPTRKNIAGVQMRPDQPFPLYAEKGLLYKNVYRKPRHVRGGDIGAFLRFMERFIPDRREREWLFDWMAYKLRWPAIPGTAVVFVADTEDDIREGEFGTGRGFMFRVVHRLYGEQYVNAQSFSMLDGSSNQSGFNDWMHGAVLVTVDESRTSPTSYRRGERSAAYEVLKDLVDPAPKRMEFKVKYGKAFNGMSYCSFWVATNHADALAIPKGDRRFTVLSNGRQMTPEERDEMAHWLDDPAGIGAVAEWLESRDLTKFDMYWPLATAAKTEMAEYSVTAVGDLLQELMAEEKRGLVFTRRQLEKEVERIMESPGGYWRGEFNAAWSTYTVGLKTDNSPWRVRIDGRQVKLFCFRKHRRAAQRLPEAARRHEAAKWGPIDDSKNLLKDFLKSMP